MRLALKIQVFFDFVCPWCAIGMRQFQIALEALAHERPDVHITVAWHSWPLLPEIPRAGVSFTPFYQARLGGDAADAQGRAQVCRAARAIGMEFAFDRIEVLPNTLAAHRLTQHIARTHGEPRRFIEALFEAHFVRGEHIGTPSVLARVAARCGIDDRDCAQALEGSQEADSLLLRERDRWHRKGVRGVPHFIFNGRRVAGVQDADALVEAMRHALAQAA